MADQYTMRPVADATRGVSIRQRVLAVVSLLASALLLAAILVFLVRNGLYVVAGLGGFVLGIAGGWWMVIRRGSARALGAVAALAGIGLLVFALVRVGEGSLDPFLKIVLVLVLLLVAVSAARAALAEQIRKSAEPASHRVTPSHPVLLCNPWSGGGKVQSFALPKLAESLGVQTVMLDRGLDLAELARDAIDRGADCLGMAGGDGSQALVASIATEHDLPFVCVSAGTRNHFALDLGLDRDDPRKSVYAFRDGIERRIDYASVNGRFFVNNVSLGVYATIVQQEGYREAKVHTTSELLPTLLGNTEQPFDLQFVTPEGETVDGAFLIQVSNNPYVLGASLDMSQRRQLDSGRLGVFAVTAATGAQAAQVVTLAMAGRGAASGHAYEFECAEFEIRSRSGKAFAGVDGEALELETPLRFKIHPGGLRMLVPEGNLEAAVRRQAHEVHLRDVWSMAAGRYEVGSTGRPLT